LKREKHHIRAIDCAFKLGDLCCIACTITNMKNSLLKKPYVVTSAVVTQVQKNGVTNLAGKNAVEQENIVTDFINTLSSYPKPFSNSTTISFTILKSQDVSLKIYDITGRLVKVQANSVYETGQHELHWNAQGVTAGTYILQIKGL